MDVFRFFSSSADVAPGKGTGETLVSPPETYAELRAIKGWRRILAESYSEAKEEALRILPLTQNAELWYGRAGGTRATALESLRSKVPPVEMEKVPKKKVKKGGADAPAADAAPAPPANSQAITNIPEGAIASPSLNAVLPSTSEVSDAEAAPEKISAIRFCPVCNYYLYLQVGEDQALSRLCRNCGFHEQDNGGMVMEMMIQERSAEGYKILLNEFTRKDPRLPHLKNIKCAEPACDSNHGAAEPDIIYIKYDAINMLYLYICDVCGFMWKSGRTA